MAADALTHLAPAHPNGVSILLMGDQLGLHTFSAASYASMTASNGCQIEILQIAITCTPRGLFNASCRQPVVKLPTWQQSFGVVDSYFDFHHTSPIAFALHRDWLRGALSTVDRSYGIFDYFHHHIADTHVAHHLFSQVIRRCDIRSSTTPAIATCSSMVTWEALCVPVSVPRADI